MGTAIGVRRPGRLFVAALVALAAALPARAQQPSVPYVPTPQEVVDRMLAMGKVGKNDYLIDLGSGDGRIVVTAAKRFGTRGFGVDLNPARIEESVANAKAAGVTDLVAFYQRDLFETDLSSATVITMYLLPRVNLELRPRLLNLRPGTRIVSHDFDMDDWRPDERAELDVKDKWGAGSSGKSSVYLWIVPAPVAGTWKFSLPAGARTNEYELTLEQRFQNVAGTVRVAGRTAKVTAAKLNGAGIALDFTVDLGAGPVRHQLTGRADANAIAGRAKLSGTRIESEADWSAVRPPVEAR